MIPTRLRVPLPRCLAVPGRRLPNLQGFQPGVEALEELTMPSISYASTVLSHDPVLYWRLDDGLGASTAVDISGNVNNGTYSGLVLHNQTGAIIGDSNRAVFLDGLNSAQVLGPNLTAYFLPNPNAETVTLSIWFNSPSGGGVLVNENDLTTGWQATHMEVQANGEVRIRVWNMAFISLGTASFNAWHHAVLRYDKAALKLDGFLDGVASASSVTGDRQAPFEFGSSQFYHVGRAGGNSMGNGVFFNGLIDEFSVYDSALSNAAIVDLYQRGANYFNELSVTKTDGVTSVPAGGAVSYTIVVANDGPDPAVGATVTDLMPPALIGVAYSATQSGGASGFTASGSGSINDTVTLPSGSSITYVVNSMVALDASGNLDNTVTVTPPPNTVDPTPSDQTAIDSDTITPLAAAAYLAPDPGDNSKTALFVIGTNANDTIVVKKAGGRLRVLQDGVSQGTFAPTGSILIFGADGDDSITVDKLVGTGALLDGGDGDDKLIGGKGRDILVGGDGTDVLKSRGGRNIVIGNLTVPSVDRLVELCDAREAWGAGQVPVTLTSTDLVDDGLLDLLYVSLSRDLTFTDQTF